MKPETRERIAREMRENQDDYRHGSNHGYHCGCRCSRCKRAHTDYEIDRKKRKRLEALELKDQQERLARMFSVASIDTVKIHGVGVVKI